jgi:hypothetical protein
LIRAGYQPGPHALRAGDVRAADGDMGRDVASLVVRGVRSPQRKAACSMSIATVGESRAKVPLGSRVYTRGVSAP